MRVIPVIDIRGGVAVHARRGRREEYAPLQPIADPVAVATALGGRCGTTTLYVADLDAIERGEPNRAALRALTAVAEVWLDAGATETTGVARRVVGTESLAATPRDRQGDGPPLVLSVDLRDGRLISPRPDLDGREATAAAPLARELGVSELLVIDLALVGSGAGPPLAAVRALAAALPRVEIYAGGGVRDNADLRALDTAGATGALVATALHEGRLTL